MSEDKDLHQSGIRSCALCDQHSDVNGSLIRATKDLEYVILKLNRQCETVDTLTKEVDTRLKVKPFYVLISVLITVLLFMLTMQLTTYSSIGDMEKKLEIVKYEIKTDLAKHEGETSQLIKRVDDITAEQKVILNNVIKHINKYPISRGQREDDDLIFRHQLNQDRPDK